VIATGLLGDDLVRPVVERAAILAYPSLYEGFGFPVLEAMSLGVPVVAGRAGGVPEVAGDAAFLVEPFDVDSIAAGLDSVLRDPGRRRDLVERGRRRARAFTWDRTARGLAEAYRDLAGVRPSTSA
jgi:glycosyltransferase involved in cell wall biosynthesis